MPPTAADKIDSDSEMSDPVLALMGVPGDEERAEEAGLGAPVVRFPPEVQAAIQIVMPSQDPLDSPDLDVVVYINKLFPTEASLGGLEDSMGMLSGQVTSIDEDMRRMVRSQTQVGGDAAAALEEAQTAILQLFNQMRDIKNAAEESEDMVKEITRDIKQLDTAKRNLSSAITSLNHLSMLVRGTATLTQLSQTRQYGEAALLLQGLLEVLNHFRSYQNIPQIKEISDQVETIKRELGEQIVKDFETTMLGTSGPSNNKQLAEACLVVSLLEPRVKRNLISWFVSHQLKEYSILFAVGEDEAWLDRLDSRYNWLKKHLIEFEERFGPLFPPDWEMSERLTAEFCRLTRADLTKLLQQRHQEVDTKLLLHSIQKTSAFENLLSRRFSGITLATSRNVEEQFLKSQPNMITTSNNPFGEPEPDALNSQNFHNVNLGTFKGIISQCFEPYLHIYLEAQDKNLEDMISKFVGDLSKMSLEKLDSGEGAPVMTSCGDLFVFYRKCLVQLGELSAGQPLLDLASLFRKYLREYTSKVIVAALQNIGNSLGGVSGDKRQLPAAMSQLSGLKDLSGLTRATSGILDNFSSFLKDDESVRFSPGDQMMICSCLVTVEYCLDTTTQLEEKMKQKVDPEMAAKISFSSELEVMQTITTDCVGLLVRELEASCRPALSAMTKLSWAGIEQVGDQSQYVTSLVSVVRATVPKIRDALQTSRKYFTQFCIKFSSQFIPKYISCVYKCKPVGTVGAEQLLLDTHSIKMVLLELPSIQESGHVKVSANGRKAPQSYTKLVVKGKQSLKSQ